VRRLSTLVAVVVAVLLVAMQSAVATGPEEFETLVAPDARGGDRFGWSIAVDGDRIVVGVPWDHLPTRKLGSAFVFTRFGLGWKIDKLTPSEIWRKGGGTPGGRQFGYSVDVSGDRVVVGAPGAWINGAETGGVFLFELIDGEWVETILEPDGIEKRDGIGRQVGFSEEGNRILVGALKVAAGNARPGSAFLFELIDGEWVSRMFLPSDGENGDEFGASVGFGDGFIAIGSPNHSSAGRRAGAIYLFDEIGGEWVETKLVAVDPKADERFGNWTRVFGEIIVTPAGDRSVIHMLRRNGDEWIRETLDVDDPTAPFEEVPESAGVLEVGERMLLAEYERTYPYRSTGAISVLQREETGWVEIDRYEGSEFGEGYGFAMRILAFEDSVIISAPGHKLNGKPSGVVYVQGAAPACGTREPTIVGTNGDDEIWGTDGDDVIVPGSGSDLIHVSGGRDVYCLNDGEYQFTGGPVAFTRSGTAEHGIVRTVRIRPAWRMLVAE